MGIGGERGKGKFIRLKHDYKVNRYMGGKFRAKKITAPSKAVIPFQLNTPPPTAA